jgi:adenosine deaminase
MYLKYRVPVALATDDPGVSRGDITQEFERAAETYHLKYQDLKKFARASLIYSFLPGEGLYPVHRPSLCAAEKAQAKNLSTGCSGLFASSEKARMQWELEKAFAGFESQF